MLMFGCSRKNDEKKVDLHGDTRESKMGTKMMEFLTLTKRFFTQTAYNNFFQPTTQNIAMNYFVLKV